MRKKIRNTRFIDWRKSYKKSRRFFFVVVGKGVAFWVKGDGDGFFDGFAEPLQTVQGFIKFFCHSITVLDSLNQVLGVAVSEGFKALELGLLAHKVSNLAKAAGDAGSVAKDLVSFFAGSELECKPVQGA